MANTYRRGVNKGRSARQFRNMSHRTKAPNMRLGAVRGGWRL